MDRVRAGGLIGVPGCVNPTYGLLDINCIVTAFEDVGIKAFAEWVTFDQAFAICRTYTGVINPIGMYHFMGIRGTDGDRIWVANSAQGYRGIYDILSRESFNALGPVQIVYAESYS